MSADQYLVSPHHHHHHHNHHHHHHHQGVVFDLPSKFDTMVKVSCLVCVCVCVCVFYNVVHVYRNIGRTQREYS